ncbi:MAG: hybrid sensor histidine kinase/response regulator [Anaerovoracaceae bacterium]
MCRKRCKLIIIVLAAVTVFAAATGYFTFVSSMISRDGKYITYDGNKGFINLGNQLCELMEEDMPMERETNVVNASMNRLQVITILAIIALAVFIFGILIFFIVSESRKNLAAKDMEILYREELFSILTNNVDEVFIMIDADDCQVGYVSPNIERILGLDEKEVRKDIRLLDELAAGPDTVRILDRLPEIALGEYKQFEREYIHNRGGQYLWFLATVYHTEINGEEKYVAMLSDRTKERRMNQTLSNALDVARSANKAKSNFLANMSHDIRTPLNAIVGFSTLLQKYADNSDKVREYSKKIADSGKHLLGLIKDVLDMSRIESGNTCLNLTEFSLSEFVGEIYTILMPQVKMKKLCFEIRSRGILPEGIVGDRLRINQVILNLLSNAIKYTQEGGTVTFTVEGLKKNRRDRAHLRFIVDDNGCGMSAEFLSRIFEPFARENNAKLGCIPGTGLGMAITKNIVDLMGGTISVKSAPDCGSTFTVDLEFQTAESGIDSEFWEKHGITRMLIADDQEEICHDVRDLMSETGVEVDCAVGGKEAVRMAYAAKEIHEEYHVIVLDWKMPDMDGIEAAGKIKERMGEKSPVMILSAYDFEDIGDEAKNAGITDFIGKPFFVSDLIRIVEGNESKELHSKSLT